MKSCSNISPLLAELAGGELSGKRADEARLHVAGCADCGQRFAELSTTVALLRRAGEAALPGGFEQGLHRKLVAAAAELPTPSWGARLGTWLALRPLVLATSAAALSALLAVGATLAVLGHGAPVGAAQPGFRIPESKVALVKIDFVSAYEINDVNFEILLPEGLRFYSEGKELAERSFQWPGKLNAGSNVVPVAVKGLRPGRYHVIAHATGDNLDVTQDVILEVTS